MQSQSTSIRIVAVPLTPTHRHLIDPSQLHTDYCDMVADSIPATFSQVTLSDIGCVIPSLTMPADAPAMREEMAARSKMTPSELRGPELDTGGMLRTGMGGWKRFRRHSCSNMTENK